MRVRAQVLLRRARVNEVGFEIVNTDLESRYRLRRLLVNLWTTCQKQKAPTGTASENLTVVHLSSPCLCKGFLHFKTLTSLWRR